MPKYLATYVSKYYSVMMCCISKSCHDKEPQLFISSINQANHILMKHYVMNVKLYHYMQKHHTEALTLDLYLNL